jgi:hypothetical protein
MKRHFRFSHPAVKNPFFSSDGITCLGLAVLHLRRKKTSASDRYGMAPCFRYCSARHLPPHLTFLLTLTSNGLFWHVAADMFPSLSPSSSSPPMYELRSRLRNPRLEIPAPSNVVPHFDAIQANISCQRRWLDARVRKDVEGNRNEHTAPMACHLVLYTPVESFPK